MADQKLTALTPATAVALTDEVYVVNDPAGTPASKSATPKLVLGLRNEVCDGRLTLETGVPISTTDQTAKTNVFFTPYGGNRVALYNGTAWILYTFTQITLALGTLTSDKNYDVFLYDNSGTLTLELTAWTNDTTRATALASQDGIWCKTGALTRRYVGTIRTTSTTTTEDSAANRFVWNAQNAVSRSLELITQSSTWNGTGTTWGPMDADTGNRVQMVIGLPGVSYIDVNVTATVQLTAASGNPAGAALGIGRDSVGGSTSANDAEITQRAYITAVLSASIEMAMRSELSEPVAIGFHFYQALQWDPAAPGVTLLFIGTDTSSNSRIAGMAGTLIC